MYKPPRPPGMGCKDKADPRPRLTCKHVQVSEIGERIARDLGVRIAWSPQDKERIRTHHGGPGGALLRSLQGRAGGAPNRQLFLLFPAIPPLRCFWRREETSRPRRLPAPRRANLKKRRCRQSGLRVFTSSAQLWLDFSHRTTAPAATSSRKSSSKAAAIPHRP